MGTGTDYVDMAFQWLVLPEPVVGAEQNMKIGGIASCGGGGLSVIMKKC